MTCCEKKNAAIVPDHEAHVMAFHRWTRSTSRCSPNVIVESSNKSFLDMIHLVCDMGPEWINKPHTGNRERRRMETQECRRRGHLCYTLPGRFQTIKPEGNANKRELPTVWCPLMSPAEKSRKG